MTMHQSAIDRMKREHMTETAIESIRARIADLEEEVAASREDIADMRARIEDDELYVTGKEHELTGLRARLAQLEGTHSVIPHHKE